MTKNDTLQKALIHIDKLQMQYDSIVKSRALDEAKYRALEQHDIITHVNDYYEKSWNSLLWVIGVLIGLFGLVIPIINQLITASNQRRSLKDLTDSISKQISEGFDNKIDLLSEKNKIEIEKLNVQFETKALELKELSDTRLWHSMGLSFLLKGLTDADAGHLKNSIYHIVTALDMYHTNGIYSEITPALSHLHHVFQKGVTIKDYREADIEFTNLTKITIKELFNKIREQSITHNYFNELAWVEGSINDLTRAK